MAKAKTVDLLVRGELCWSSIAEPRAYEKGDQKKYEATVKVSKAEHDRIEEVMTAFESDIGIKESERRKVQWCLYEGKEGGYFFKCSSPNKPPVVNANREKIGNGDVWDGCKVVVSARVWFQDNKFGKRLNAFLNGVMLVREGERKGSRPIEETFAGAADLDLSFADEPDEDLPF